MKRRPQLSPLEPRRLLAAGYQIELVFEASVDAGVRAVVQQAANRWQQVITTDILDAPAGAWGAAVDDLRLTVRVKAIDGGGGGVAQTRPTYIRNGSNLPIAAELELDSADLASQTAAGVLDDLVTHEMTHALGYGTTWKQYPGLTSGTGGGSPLYLGANAVREYKALGGTGNGIPLETTGGAGTRDVHWSESVFNNELLTGFINGGANVISRITIGALADLGYGVNYGVADYYTIPGVTPPVVNPPTPSPATFSGRVFLDADRDGVFDGNESGINGRTVYVDANLNNSLDAGERSATTNASGSFTITNISAGSYAIRQVVPGDQYQTTPASGGAIWVTLAAGQNASGYVFGSATPQVTTPPPANTGQIRGKLFDDRDGDGTQDAGEANLANRTVYIDADNDGQRDANEAAKKTKSNGTYVFGELPAGSYVVRQVLPTGYAQTIPTASAAQVITLGSGGAVTDAHFGSRANRSAVLGGKLFNDKDRDGKQDKGEGDLRGITLWLDLDDDAKFDRGIEPTATTDGKGQYRFTGLAAGDYTVRVALKDGWQQVWPKKNKPQRATLDAGESVTNLHFGLRK